MGFWNFLKANNDEYSGDEGYTEEEEAQEEKAPVTSTAKVSGGIASTSSLEMKICKPERYEEVTKIATHLLEHKTVVLNLELANKETIVRIIDFLSGVTYAINGNLKRVASSTYVITPEHVDVTGEQNAEVEASVAGAAKPRELF